MSFCTLSATVSDPRLVMQRWVDLLIITFFILGTALFVPFKTQNVLFQGKRKLIVFPCHRDLYMAQVWRWYGITYGYAMDDTWLWHRLLLSISNPYLELSSFNYNSFVLYCGSATYLGEIHGYPVSSCIGMKWLSPIPTPSDLWPLTLGVLYVW